MSEAVNEKREPSTGMSFAVFGISIAIILLGVVVLGFDIHIILLVALAFACLVSATLGYQFDDLVECMKKPLGQAMSAMIIFTSMSPEPFMLMVPGPSTTVCQ